MLYKLIIVYGAKDIASLRFFSGCWFISQENL